MKEKEIILTSDNLVYEDDEIGSYSYSDGILCYSSHAQMRWSYAVYAGPANNEIEGPIVIPSRITICGKEFQVKGINSFCGCRKITSIFVSDSIVDIKGDEFFSGCDSLESIIIDKNNQFMDSRNDCNAIIYTRDNWLILGCKNTIIPSDITHIRHFAFENCTGLSSIIIPESVQSIGEYAFCNCCGLKTITIPDCVSSIGTGAFEGCTGLDSIVVSNENSVYDSRNNCNAIIETTSDTLISGCKNTVIPEGLTKINEGAFAGITNLKQIKLPSSLLSIGESSFSNSGLVSIVIPKNVEHIDNAAFYGCKLLESIIVDKDNSIFDSRNNCNAIIETASNKLLFGCKNTVIPPTVEIIGESAFQEHDEITTFVIPEGIVEIEPNAFMECRNLKSIYSYIKDPNSCFVHISAFIEHGDSTTLYVPKGSIDAYKKAQGGWHLFENIQELKEDNPFPTHTKE